MIMEEKKKLFRPSTNSGKRSKTILVKAPPSSKIMFKGFLSSPKSDVCSRHQSNSS
jgi:hypothetical protein